MRAGEYAVEARFVSAIGSGHLRPVGPWISFLPHAQFQLRTAGAGLDHEGSSDELEESTGAAEPGPDTVVNSINEQRPSALLRPTEAVVVAVQQIAHGPHDQVAAAVRLANHGGRPEAVGEERIRAGEGQSGAHAVAGGHRLGRPQPVDSIRDHPRGAGQGKWDCELGPRVAGPDFFEVDGGEVLMVATHERDLRRLDVILGDELIGHEGQPARSVIFELSHAVAVKLDPDRVDRAAHRRAASGGNLEGEIGVVFPALPTALILQVAAGFVSLEILEPGVGFALVRLEVLVEIPRQSGKYVADVRNEVSVAVEICNRLILDTDLDEGRRIARKRINRFVGQHVDGQIATADI